MLTREFCEGELFDAIFKRKLPLNERICAVLRAKQMLKVWRDHIRSKVNLPGHGHFFTMQRSFISSQNYKALDALCDAFVKLVIVHREHYPALPFLPWQHGSLPIEKFFAISRKFFPNFTFAEFVGVIRHVLLRETALLNLARQGIHIQKEKSSGYIFDTTLEQLTPDELKTYRVRVTRSQIAEAADLAWDEVLALLQEVCHDQVTAARDLGINVTHTIYSRYTLLSYLHYLSSTTTMQSLAEPRLRDIQKEMTLEMRAKRAMMMGWRMNARHCAQLRTVNIQS